MKKRWVIKNSGNPPSLQGYPSLVQKLLYNRGITNSSEAVEFLNPDYGRLHDPFLFSAMRMSVERIWQAIETGEKITIYADYDADAITACAVMFRAFSKLGAQVDYYIPDRFSEGYGMNSEAVERIAAAGTKLIITVDCGINAVAETETALKAGVDVIITDHHELTGQLPQAFSVINPKNPADNYPFKYLTGVGVAFKVVQALFADAARLEARNAVAGWEKWLLDLVAIGTVADCQALMDENRVLVSFGLKVLAKTRWPGLKSLIDAAGTNNRLDTYVLGFIIAPRINAAGRISHASVALKLLVSDDPKESFALAGELNQLNIHRQQLTERVISEAREQVELMMEKRVLLAAGQDWPKGVVGLVAGRLAEEYGRPVLILEKGEEFATGSGRASGAFDLVAALNYSKEYLSKYGGHTQAAGFTLPTEKIPYFHQKLIDYAETMSVQDSEPVLELDAELDVNEINFDNLEMLEKFEPFGFGNPRPKFACYGAELMEFRLVGAEQKHLKLNLRLGDRFFPAIAFNMGYLALKLLVGQKVDVAAELSSNEWNGNKEIQLKVLDLKLPE